MSNLFALATLIFLFKELIKLLQVADTSKIEDLKGRGQIIVVVFLSSVLGILFG